PAARIVGVEIDPAVLRLAQSRFGLAALGIEAVRADARDFLQNSRSRFDLILEDCFIGNQAELQKPQGIPEPAFAWAAQRLCPGGVLASNAIDEGPAIAASLRRRFRNLVQIRLAGYDNRIFIGGGASLSARALRRAVAAMRDSGAEAAARAEAARHAAAARAALRPHASTPQAAALVSLMGRIVDRRS
ncbi:MAG: hypothetical protein EB832_04695, partial [Thaumarchaeota archaeon S14]